MSTTYVPVPPGPEKDILDKLDTLSTHWVVVQGVGAARAVYGIYRSLRLAEKHSGIFGPFTPIAPLVYLLAGGIWYLVSRG